MDAVLFVEKLKKYLPDREVLSKLGYEEMPINAYDKIFNLRKLEIKKGLKATNEIAKLFREYEVNRLRFGDYSFLSEYEDYGDYSVFCTSSNTFLIIDKLSEGEIHEIDYDEHAFVDYCAKNAECFLQALLVYYELLSKRILKIHTLSDNEVNEKYAEKCTELAGGQKYDSFFRGLII